MDFGVDTVGADTEEEKKFRQEARDFLDKELTPDVSNEREAIHDHLDSPHTREFTRKLSAKGWLAPPSWPKEYTGRERSPAERRAEMRILAEELSSHGMSVRMDESGGIQGAVVFRHGSEEMKREFLPKIARAEISFSLGYTEPNAGTDLASLEMRAVREGDEYVINGQKLYSTNADTADYHWLAARTNFDVPKHKGISLFIVDLKSPGITIRPLQEIAGGRTNEVFYDNVRVPKKNLVGEENQGWGYIREALGAERTSITDYLDSGSYVGQLVQYAKETERNGRPLAEDPIVRQSLAQLEIENRIRRLFGSRTEWLLRKGIVPDVEPAIGKVWGCELDQRVANTGMQILGLYGQLKPGSKWAPLRGRIEHLYQFAVHTTYGGGSHELLRSLIATRGMGLPREPRV